MFPFDDVIMIWNTLRPDDPYMCQVTGLSLVQVVACRLHDTKPLPELMATYRRDLH